MVNIKFVSEVSEARVRCNGYRITSVIDHSSIPVGNSDLFFYLALLTR